MGQVNGKAANGKVASGKAANGKAANGKASAFRAAQSRELQSISNGEPRQPRRPGKADYSPEIGRLICERMLEIGTLPEACRRCSDLPDRITVYLWSYAHSEFADALMRTREILSDRWADEMQDIADDSTCEPNDRRVKIDTRKWLMSKWAPRRFGDKIQVGGDPENPIRVLHEAVAIDRLSSIEMAALEQFARARIAAQDVESVDISKTYDETTV